MSSRDRLLEMWRVIDGEGRLDLFDRYFGDGYVRHSEEGEMNRAEFHEALTMLRVGFPDMETRIVDTVAEGERVAYRWVAEGTHTGPFMGAPPTDRRVRAGGLTVSTFGADGRVESDWASWNRPAVLHALDIVPIDLEKRTNREGDLS